MAYKKSGKSARRYSGKSNYRGSYSSRRGRATQARNRKRANRSGTTVRLVIEQVAPQPFSPVTGLPQAESPRPGKAKF